MRDRQWWCRIILAVVALIWCCPSSWAQPTTGQPTAPPPAEYPTWVQPAAGQPAAGQTTEAQPTALQPAVQPTAGQSTGTENRKPVMVEGKTFLPLRVLSRPFSNIYKDANETSAIVQENVPVFQMFYVYTRPVVSIAETTASGWYEVGSDNRGAILGWMKADDVMEWKQTMCVAYEHPSGRRPVLMFEKLDALRNLLKSPSDGRVKQAETYYTQIDAKNTPPDFPIVSREPKEAIDINEQFYLLPILEHARIDIEGREGRMLKIAAATKADRGATTLANMDTQAASAGATGGNPDTTVLQKLEIDIVYVVDATASMGPYINATRDAIKNISLEITKNPEIAQSVHFGLWAYRDSMNIKGIEYLTKNFTPQLQGVDAFVSTLSGVKEATVGSEGYEEDMFSGADKAMRETTWTDGALHILVLLGDAPSHPLGHKWNASGHSADTLRAFADDNKFYWLAIHIKDKEAEKYWATSESQFQTLSMNRGLVGESTYIPVPSNDMDAFGNASKSIAGTLVRLFKMDRQAVASVGQPAAGGQPSAGTPPVAASPASDTNPAIAKMVEAMYQAAKVDWIGREKSVQAPRDIIAWVTDKDLMEPAVPSLDVRVLINKKQIDSLRTVLQEIMSAGRRGIIGGEKFFDSLQAVPSVAARSGDQIRNAKSLAETNLIPEFMQDLPYESKIMSMSNELWASWSLDQQEEFLNEVDAKIQLYATIHDEPKGWIALSKGDDPDEYVYPLSLETLP